jgi:hypothetical protein
VTSATAPGDTITLVMPVRGDSAAHAAEKNLSLVRAQGDSAVKVRGPARAPEAQLFLSWNAPWGHRRAARSRMPACSDSAAEDTLYLCVRTGRHAEKFSGFTASLLVHPTGSDSLGDWWKMKGKGGLNPGSLRVEWAAQNDWFGVPQPFPVSGQGFTILDNQPYLARLRMIFAVAYDAAVPAEADPLFVLARVVWKHHPERRLAGCDQPVVIEWEQATMSLGLADEPKVARGERLVSFGGPYALTEPFHGPRTQAWKPGRLAPPGK